MTKDNTPLTEFSWIRMGRYTAIICAMWVAMGIVTDLITTAFSIKGIDASFPGMTLAIASAVAWEYIRRDRARKQAKLAA